LNRQTRLVELKSNKRALPKTKDGKEGKLATIEEEEMKSIEAKSAGSMIKADINIEVFKTP